jgi:hypothetical protein
MKKMKKIKKIICLVLAATIMIGSFTVADMKVSAAAPKQGDKRVTYQTLTLAEVDSLCTTFESILAGHSTASNISSGVITAAGLALTPVASVALGFSAMGLSYVSKADFQREYNFYNKVRHTMAQKNYKKVKIQYTSIYRVNKMYGDFTGGWYAYGKSVSQYLKK